MVVCFAVRVRASCRHSDRERVFVRNVGYGDLFLTLSVRGATFFFDSRSATGCGFFSLRAALALPFCNLGSDRLWLDVAWLILLEALVWCMCFVVLAIS